MHDKDDADTALYFQLFNEIGIINQLASRQFERALPHGLTLAQFGVLNHCVRLGDNQTPAALASAFQVTKGTMTSTLKRLEAKRFITIAPDPKDGRAKRVRLTPAGRSARQASLEAAAPLLELAAKGLSKADIQTLTPTLQKLRAWLDENR